MVDLCMAMQQITRGLMVFPLVSDTAICRELTEFILKAWAPNAATVASPAQGESGGVNGWAWKVNQEKYDDLYIEIEWCFIHRMVFEKYD